MTPQLKNLCTTLLTDHEGKRYSPYDDKSGLQIKQLPNGGKITIGIGRNLCDRPLTEAEIQFLFANDLEIAYKDAQCAVGATVFAGLTCARQAVLIDMAFNLGLARLMGFRNTLLAVKEQRYNDAADGMRTSKWATQVRGRAEKLARMMEEG